MIEKLNKHFSVFSLSVALVGAIGMAWSPKDPVTIGLVCVTLGVAVTLLGQMLVDHYNL